MKKTINGVLVMMIGLLPIISISQVQAQKGDVKVSHIDVTNSGPDSINVICVRVEISIVDTSENFFCWNECFIPSVDSSGIWRIGPGETVTDKFVGDYEIQGGQALTDTSIIRYLFYVAENPQDSASITIAYSAASDADANYGNVVLGSLPLGLNDALTENKNATLNLYPNPAESVVTVDYTLKRGAKDGAVILRNILGEIVYTGAVYGAFGKTLVPVEQLHNGVYFCTIVVEGEVQQTRRLVVKH
jgi:hypothetical protein